MSNTIDLDNLTIKDIERLKEVLGVKSLTEEDRIRQRQADIGTRPGWIKVTQINYKGCKYICTTDQEIQNFKLNNPGDSESFTIELPIISAEQYMERPENKKAFAERKDNV